MTYTKSELIRINEQAALIRQERAELLNSFPLEFGDFDPPGSDEVFPECEMTQREEDQLDNPRDKL